MKKSLNAWSVPGNVGFEETFAALSAAGFDGVELNVDSAGAHALTMETSREELAKIAGLSEKYNLAVSGISTSLGGKTGSDSAEVREFQKRLIFKQIEFAKALGADGILTVPGGMSESVSLLKAHENSLKFYDEIKADIAAEKVFVGVENVWNDFFSSPFHMKSFIDQLECPYIGAYFDVGNVAEFSTPEFWIEVLGDAIKKVHVKDFKRGRGIHSGGCFVNLLEGDVNWKNVTRAFKEVGYEGYLTAELDVMKYRPDYLYGITSKALDAIINL